MGFEPTPFQTSALNWRLRPLGQLTTDNTHTTHNTTHNTQYKHTHNKHTHIHTNTHNDTPQRQTRSTHHKQPRKHDTRNTTHTNDTYKRHTKRDTRIKRTTLLSYASTHSSKPRSTRARPCIHRGEPMRITEHIHTARRQNTQKQKRERKHGSREQQLCSVVSISRPSSGNSTTADHRPPTSTCHLPLITYPSVSERVESRGCR